MFRGPVPPRTSRFFPACTSADGIPPAAPQHSKVASVTPAGTTHRCSRPVKGKCSKISMWSVYPFDSIADVAPLHDGPCADDLRQRPVVVSEGADEPTGDQATEELHDALTVVVVRPRAALWSVIVCHTHVMSLSPSSGNVHVFESTLRSPPGVWGSEASSAESR